MVTRILHVEDDLALRALVEIAFTGFGFRGTTIAAGTVAEAIERLEDAVHHVETFDLILCDMNLPDGTGLDVVSYVRASDVWRATPVLILSGDVNPRLVGRAYALGANAYVNKSPPGRTLMAVMKSLYEHWAGDALLPPAWLPSRELGFLRKAISLRTRHAQLYHRLAETFGDSRTESAFWLSRSLAESNLINLLGFMRGQSDRFELPEGFFDELAEMQAATARALTVAEHALEQTSITRDEAYRLVVDLLTQVNIDLLANLISGLFPVHPVAMEALRDFLLGTAEDVAAWIDLHSADEALRKRAAQLRSRVAPLAKHPGAPIRRQRFASRR